ncbi:tyrosinase-like [Rhinoraja longicauda]
MERLLVLLVLSILAARPARSQFPRVCTTPSALQAKTCCPVWVGDGSACGRASGRGSCLEVVDVPVPRHSTSDFRLTWPTRFYTSVCSCGPRFAGFDCGDCQEGYRGPECRGWQVRVRKGLHQMAPGEMRRFLAQLDLAKRTVSPRYVVLTSRNTSDPAAHSFRNATVFDVTTWVHYMAAKAVGLRTEPNFAHMGAAFTVWHRRYLAFFEQEMRWLTKDEWFTLPFWDWTREPHCDICTDAALGRSGPDGLLRPPSIFARWETMCTYDGDSTDYFQTICLDPLSGTKFLNRNPGGDHRVTRLPTAQDVSDAMKLQDYDNFPFNQYAIFSFRNVVEGYKSPSRPGTRSISLHNLVHAYLNGTISNVAEASNDPVFLLHHAFIDKIVEDWLRADERRLSMYPTSRLLPQGHGARAYMVPFLPLVRNIDYFKLSVHFGYTYAGAAYERQDLQSKAPA